MKKIISIIFLYGFLFCSINAIHAEENEFARNPDGALFKSASPSGWVKFKDNLPGNPAEVFSRFKKSFGLTGGYDMRLKKTKTDDLGFTHYRFQQTLFGKDVIGGEFFIRVKNGVLQSGNGKIYTSAIVRDQQNISEQNAITIALNYVNAEKYYWQDTTYENKLKRKSKNQAATFYPAAELYYVYTNTLQLQLTYKVLIEAFDPGKSGYVYIDAGDGKVFKWEPSEISCSPTTVNTVWYGNQTINTHSSVTGGWDLEDDCGSSTYNVSDDNTWNNALFNSPDNQWLTPRERSAATCLWSIDQTRDVYLNHLQRDGHDAFGANLDIYFDATFADGSHSNASFQPHLPPFWDDYVNVGRGEDVASITDDFGVLDILAHEFTHGVNHYEADLASERESGALNESFADVMAEYVEKKVLLSNNWLLGWDRIENGVHVPARNFMLPRTSHWAQPDRYNGTLWWDASNNCIPVGPGEPGYNDKCGVHYNNGVQNRMYYLLSMGGVGWSDDSISTATGPTIYNSYQWAVAGIGIENAGRIAYRALTVYLGENSNYTDSRNAWVAAATDIFGECSFFAIQTGKAWYAVGLGPPVQTMAICNTNYGASPINLTTPRELIVSNNCTVNILPTGNLVEFKGSSIGFKPGFSSATGSNFSAKADDECAFATY
jgi:Zn-dependent metalloprotease